MKAYNGKAIYSPKGKAKEYGERACNFYVGCSNECIYCYLKKGRGANIMGGNTPTLKKCFKDEQHAIEVFEKELLDNKEQLQKSGLFFSFTTDPMLGETWELTFWAIDICNKNRVPVKLLTKNTDWVNNFIRSNASPWDKQLLAIGFTLTGRDKLEPYANSNFDRIMSIRGLSKAGFKTFASIEPIIDFESSLEMIKQTIGYCDLYKIGLESGRKYDKDELKSFVSDVLRYVGDSSKIYFKDSLLRQAGIERSELPEVCVGADYNMFLR